MKRSKQQEGNSVPAESSKSVTGDVTKTPPNKSHLSLEGLHGTVAVPPQQASSWQHWRAFVGPAILISVGYMDPGNWGTDLAGGAQFKYGLLWVVGLASLMAIFLQVIAARTRRWTR